MANIWRDVEMTDKSRRRVTIFVKDDCFGVCIAGKGDDRTFEGGFESQAEAIASAFASIDHLRSVMMGTAELPYYLTEDDPLYHTFESGD